MEMPKVTDAHRKLEKLVGNWSGEETIAPSPWDPAGGTAIGRALNRPALDGFAVIQDYEQERNGAVNFRGHGVFRYDPIENCYEMIWLDSWGMAPSTFKGQFEGDVLTVSSKTMQGFGRAVFDLGTPGRYHFRMEVSPDGKQWSSFMEGRYAQQT